MPREPERPNLNVPLLTENREQEHGFGLLIGKKNSFVSKESSEIVEEVKKQLWLAGPLISVNVLQFCLQLISVMFVGHLGELSLSSASIATSFASVSGFSLLMGMGSALDTLCGQSYGAKQYHMLGIHMQRAMFVLLLVSVPLAFIWANTGLILLAVGQRQDISFEAGVYARYMIPSIFAFGLLQCEVRFLLTQSIVLPMMISSAVTALSHILVCWVLVFKTDLGYRGAAMANAISYWINTILLALFIKFSDTCKRTWTEVWSFDMMVLLSGFLPNPKLETSVLSISLNTNTVLFMIASGLGGTISTRVSNELGAGNPKGTRLAVQVVLLITITQGIITGSILILIRSLWGHAYSNEEELVSYVATMLPFISLSSLLDGIQGVLSGTIRGCGRQKIGAFINLGAYYLVDIPSAILLAFVLHMGGKGLWLGIICALSVQVVSLLTATLRTDWEHEAKQAANRVYGATVPVNLVA
ncbi:hypothetical protein MKW98_012301 [Papaver atlanticum]|uniref:Protein DETOXIFICATION n=1 Tax=Papaver atlanticum TaxID=357466 RepID=A0AAD4XQ55_9MAGN|nr:hypothetical protein MKW98_012301 [Papaver atlanticum]